MAGADDQRSGLPVLGGMSESTGSRASGPQERGREIMRYKIRIDGKWNEQDSADGPMFGRGDMAFWGFGRSDVSPPVGYTLGFDANHEPVFVDQWGSAHPDHVRA